MKFLRKALHMYNCTMMTLTSQKKGEIVLYITLYMYVNIYLQECLEPGARKPKTAFVSRQVWKINPPIIINTMILKARKLP